MLEIAATHHSLVSGYSSSVNARQAPEQTSLVRPAEESGKSNANKKYPDTEQPSQNPDDKVDKTTQSGKQSTTAVPELTSAEQRQIQQLSTRDRQVRAHEQAHLSAAGGIAKGGADYQYARGPDGKMYAIGGEVSIDSSKVAGDPEATLRKASQIRAAALAPAQPSAQDVAVASRAARMAAEARLEISAELSRALAESRHQNNNKGEIAVKAYHENTDEGQEPPKLALYA
ncbi:MAG: putative metalloprotease CJM1_0395 family protein [Gammaproteobacteria bacterium]|nr:putative metalloprotease CJM1_0395 family protein [Gammaproteobacteria bacterium]